MLAGICIPTMHEIQCINHMIIQADGKNKCVMTFLCIREPKKPKQAFFFTIKALSRYTGYETMFDFVCDVFDMW